MFPRRSERTSFSRNPVNLSLSGMSLIRKVTGSGIEVPGLSKCPQISLLMSLHFRSDPISLQQILLSQPLLTKSQYNCHSCFRHLLTMKKAMIINPTVARKSRTQLQMSRTLGNHNRHLVATLNLPPLEPHHLACHLPVHIPPILFPPHLKNAKIQYHSLNMALKFMVKDINFRLMTVGVLFLLLMLYLICQFMTGHPFQ